MWLSDLVAEVEVLMPGAVVEGIVNTLERVSQERQEGCIGKRTQDIPCRKTAGLDTCCRAPLPQC